MLDTYDFGRVKLQAVAITLDESRLLGVGPLTESPSGLTPSRSQAEKRLVGLSFPFHPIIRSHTDLSV